MIDITNNDELYHYGVLGMKWGQHRANVHAAKAEKARAKGNEKAAAKHDAKSTYNYKSIVTKHHEKKAAKLDAKANKTGDENVRAKANKFADKAEKGRQWDKARQDYSKTASTGAAIARKLLLTSSLDRVYQNSRAAGYSVKKAAAHTTTVGLLSSVGGALLGPGGITTVQHYSKAYEGRTRRHPGSTPNTQYAAKQTSKSVLAWTKGLSVNYDRHNK